MKTKYRAICASCEHTTFAFVDETIPTAEQYRTGVYRCANGQLALKCSECGETKHAVPHSA